MIDLYSDIDFEGLTQTLGGLYWDVLLADLVSIQTKSPQFGEVRDVHDTAETPKSKLFDLVGLQVEVLQGGADYRDSL